MAALRPRRLPSCSLRYLCYCWPGEERRLLRTDVQDTLKVPGVSEGVAGGLAKAQSWIALDPATAL